MAEPMKCDACGKPLPEEHVTTRGVLRLGRAVIDLGGHWCDAACLVAGQKKRRDAAQRTP